MIELVVDGISSNAEGVARDDSGRVVFVHGAIPGDVVEAEVTTEHKRFARASLERVLQASPQRRTPPCLHRLQGCGGCGLQHATPEGQRDLKMRMVRDALQRIGRIEGPDLIFGGGVSPAGYRTTVRAGVVDGRAGFREHRSHELVATPGCIVAHPTLRELMAEGRFPDATGVFMRVGHDPEDCVAVVDPARSGSSTPRGRLVGREEVPATDLAAVEERVRNRSFRVSANSFFQSGPAAADLLVGTVDSLLDRTDRRGALVDLYTGVGLLVGLVEFDGRRIGVEHSRTAVGDARVNLTDLEVSVVETPVETWVPEQADVAIADPSRAGLGRRGVEVVASTRAADLVLVSCDAGALGRDAGLLTSAGFHLQSCTVLDLFPETSHVEVVSHFTRSEGENRPSSP
ncbi:MAG: class I SAM-dependent RNA methyltransferase [Acidimicrobiales bacterium]